MLPRLTDIQIIDALMATMGKVCLAAERLGCRPEVIYARARGSTKVGGTIRFFRGKLLDAAESALWKAILDGQSWAVRLALAEWGRSRAFSDGAEVWHAPGWRDAQAAGELVRKIVQEVLNQHEQVPDPQTSSVDSDSGPLRPTDQPRTVADDAPPGSDRPRDRGNDLRPDSFDSGD